MSEFRLKSKLRLGHLGRKVEKAGLSFMTAPVVKCDRFNSILLDFPPVSGLIRRVADYWRLGEIHNIKIMRRYAPVCSLDSWIGKTGCDAGLRSGTHQKYLKVRRGAASLYCVVWNFHGLATPLGRKSRRAKQDK